MQYVVLGQRGGDPVTLTGVDYLQAVFDVWGGGCRQEGVNHPCSSGVTPHSPSYP